MAAAWYRLERAGAGDLLPVVLASNKAKVQAIADVQAKGILPTRFPASVLLGLIIHLSGFWSSNVPEYDVLVETARLRLDAKLSSTQWRHSSPEPGHLNRRRVHECVRRRSG